MVSVNMRDEHRAQVGDVYSLAAKPGESGWRGVDDVAPINHGKGVVTPMGRNAFPVPNMSMRGAMHMGRSALLVPIGRSC